MTDDRLQALYDILGEAYKAGRDDHEEGPTAGNVLFSLAARMEEEITRIVKDIVGSCIVTAEEVAMDLHKDGERAKSFGADIVAFRLREEMAK